MGNFLDLHFAVDSYFEYFMTILGWVINNGIWQLMLDTGLFAAPLLGHIIRLFLKVREQGDDEGNKGRLLASWLENTLYMSLLIMYLTCVPLFKVSYTTIKMDESRMAQCGRTVLKPSETGFAGLSSELDGKSANLPLWWAFTYSVGKGLTHGAVATLPCKPDLRQIRYEVQNTQIKSPTLRNEVMEFESQCYRPAKSFLLRQQYPFDAEQARDLDWYGSRILLNTQGLYDSYRSQNPRINFPYQADRDAALPNTGLGGYPTCKEWWEKKDVGLKARLIGEVAPDLWTKMTRVWTDENTYQDDVIRHLVSPLNLSVSNGAVYHGYANHYRRSEGYIGMDTVNAAAGFVGTSVGSVLSGPIMYAVREALPMVQAFALLAINIALPVIMILGSYEIRVMMTVTAMQIGIFFLSFWWELGRWLDSWFSDALYNSGTHVSRFSESAGNVYGDGVFGLVNATMFIALPALWFGMVSWAGFNVGTALSGIISSGVADTKNATQKGEDVTLDASKNAADRYFKEKEMRGK